MSDKTWQTVRLGDVAHVEHGWPFRSEEFVEFDGNLPIVVAIGNFDYTGGFRFHNSTIKAYRGEYPRKFELLPDDIMLVMTCQTAGGEILGVPARVPDDGRTYLHNQRIGKFIVDDPSKLDANFFYQWARSKNFNKQLFLTATGTKILHTSPDRISQASIRLPPLREQQAVADILGVLDDKIAANDQIAVTALGLADALFLASMERDIGTLVTIGELVDRGVLAQGDGYRTKRAEYGQPGFRILRAGDIRGGRIIPEGSDFVSESYARQIGQKTSRSNDIIMTTKGSVGRVAVVPPDLETVVYSPQICYFRVLDEEALDHGYLAAWFRSSDLQAQASQLMFKSDMAPYINLRDIRSLTVPVPNWTEQRKQGELQRSLLAAVHAVHAENRRLGRTRDELLPLLMSGQVRVRDAETIVERVV